MPRAKHKFKSDTETIMPYAKRSRTSSATAKKTTAIAKARGIKNRGGIWPAQKYYAPYYYDPFPYKAYAIMRYSEVVTLNPGVGTIARNVFRANGIFDPNQTGTGHQPYGHDQYSAIYNHYRVMESRITMTPTESDNGIYGINLIPNVASAELDYDTVREQKGVNLGIVTNNSGNYKTISSLYKTGMFDNNAETSALFGASPTEQFFYDCFFESKNSTSDAASMAFLITITYKVAMWEPKMLGQS